MSALSTTVGVYDNMASAEKDWAAIEDAASKSSIDLADAALVYRPASGDVKTIHRQEHHGWGKGAVAGGVVGLLFPPAIIAGAALGGVGGAVVGTLSRCLNRHDIKDLGETMDRGQISVVVVSAIDSVAQVHELLAGASHKMSRGDMPADKVMEAMDAAGLNPH